MPPNRKEAPNNTYSINWALLLYMVGFVQTPLRRSGRREVL